ncbi:Ulp1-like peptidase [Cucumis melo var. makuwa]|uniref:Ulp1-like peptidase n=1 Tax=Cucumis melo var. makuwa TaxID=1194695 RepID=A0A5D3DSK7_CUCMM|nr:Ulp1-like peptidase [Cucumis melo var. makuwa]
MWQVDEKLWNKYLEWKGSRKTTHEERPVVSTTRKKDFFKKLEENTWILGDITDNKKADWKDTTTHLNLWAEKNLEYYFNTAVGDFQEKPGWGNVNYMIGCINIKEHWLTIAANMKKCKIYEFDSMPDYVEQKLVDQALQMPTRCIASLVIAIGVDLHAEKFKYGPWPVLRSTKTLQRGRSLDCGIFCCNLLTHADHDCLTVKNMKLFRQQYVLELWANKYFC